MREIADGYDVESIRAVTEADFHVSENLKPMRVDGMSSWLTYVYKSLTSLSLKSIHFYNSILLYVYIV